MAQSRGDASVDGGAPSRSRDADETTARLLEAAAQEFIEHGYEATRVNDIARRVGLTSGAVYARWPHKPDVLVAALNHIFQKILPEQELENLGGAGRRSPDKLALLGTNLLAFDEHKDVMTQVFGSARNNEAIRECLLEYLNEEAGQLSRLVEQMRDDGFIGPDYSAASIAFLGQALGIGTHLLITVKLDECHIPTEHDWITLLATLINSVAPKAAPPPAPPNAHSQT